MTASPLTTAPELGAFARATAVPLYFGEVESPLFGWYHAPRRDRITRCAVVLCAPIGDEAIPAHRSLRHWADRLAESGVPVLRFDYVSTGDASDGDAGAELVEAWVDSVRRAVTEVRRRAAVETVVVAGVRLGGTLALAAAPDCPEVEGLILWAALPSGNAFVRERRAFTRLLTDAIGPAVEGWEQLGGMALRTSTVDALRALAPLDHPTGAVRHALIVPRDGSPPDVRILERLATDGVETQQRAIGGYSAMVVDAHETVVPDEMIDASIEWLHDRFAAIEQPDGGVRPLGAPVTVPRAQVTMRVDVLDEPEAASRSVVTEEAVGVSGRVSLFGILSLPGNDVSAARDTAIVLVNAGSVHRVGPNRLYVSLARQWAALGYRVLRVDLGGIGDSPTPNGGTENHPYPEHAVQDIADAVQAVRGLPGVRRVVLAGLCSGAHASFHAIRQLSHVDGAMLVNPIVFYWKATDELSFSAWRMHAEARRYQRTMTEWRAWLRLLRGQVDVRFAVRALRHRAGAVVGARIRRQGGASGKGERGNAGVDIGRILTSGRRLLLLFSEGEPGLDHLRLEHRRALRRFSSHGGFALRVLERADHTLTSLDARLRAAREMTCHLLDHYA